MNDAGASGRKGILWSLIQAGIFLGLALVPTQLGFKAFGVRLSWADPVVLAAFALWLAHEVASRSLLRGVRVPLFAVLFVVALSCSSFVADKPVQSAREVLQAIAYFIVAFMLFAGTSDGDADPRRRTLFLLCVTSVVVLHAAAQYLNSEVAPMNVRATFGSRSILGGYLALVLPLFYGQALYEARWGRRIWLGGCVAAGVLVCLSGGALVAMAVSLAVMSAVRGSRVLLGFLVCLVLFAGLVAPHLWRDNIEIASDSIALFNAQGDIADRYSEWQAAVAMWRDRPFLGVGAGNYQANIGTYYGFIPHSNQPLKEADLHNLYLVLLGSTGLCGFAAFVGLLLSGGVKAARAFVRAGTDARRGLCLGLVGSVLAFAVVNVWNALLVRGTWLAFVVVLSLIAAMGRQARDARRGEDGQATP